MTKDTDLKQRRYPADRVHKNPSFLFPKSKFYNVKITVIHWQLRDLICRNSLNPNMMLYSSNESIMSLNMDDHSKRKMQSKNPMKNNSSEKACQFEFSPRSFKEQDGIIVAGGLNVAKQNRNGTLNDSPRTGMSTRFLKNQTMNNWKGQFGLCANDSVLTMDVGSLINNSVSITKKSNNQYQSILCNNDRHLYALSYGNREITKDYIVNLEVPLNHSTESPDAKTLVVCSDSSKVFLLHPEESTNQAQTLQCDNGYDCGISSSFHPSGIYFTACFQDGVALVYDVRNLNKPVHKVYSTRESTQSGAFRCCKFAKGTDDLLFITEHSGRIHMVDTRDFTNHLVIMLPNSIRNATMDYQDNEYLYNEPIVQKFDDMINFESSNYSDDGRLFGNSSELQLETQLPPTHQYCGIELAGLEWFQDFRTGRSYLAVGSDRGLIKWKVDSWSRRCFPSFVKN
ncbi:hypothetical protein PP7435_CHR3-0160 [Komagataella phaffii CBS 7435]|uniref:DUF2415 domain-containing protein n=1 Tax=Komagataella phaffii (strain ATCC 76273 / CBS 7435 / CECT 11047 / NRRL Y-11430 / Wegner 21-1) TaxID=981350 RepID=F2QUQ4_KOMPC|nr:GQ67_04140T0 [Komagataella phaffii]AOA68778.1 GQ68_04113T0 [Komagataella phaffii GS115]CAH2449090.1 Hypothetical protein BQ9382_C3-0915 [Komagataella phaffii CBS 7435]CCA39132.1 hypothetical protein PP7435_CHR3-0160 [Komagataella phaffii CBS 7435]